MSSCLVGLLWGIGAIVWVIVMINVIPAIVDMIVNWKPKPKKKSALEEMGDDDDEYNRKL